jgi:Zn-dependent M28 family amino/carboxypeptidase
MNSTHCSILLLLIAMGCRSTPKINLEMIQNQIKLGDTKTILYTLASDEMKGRDSKNGGYFKATHFVESFFKNHNIKPFYPNYRDSLVTDSIVSYNLVGQIGEFDSTRETILIGAHLDHIGVQHIEGDSIFNGANDNASGSTAVLQIGKVLAQYSWDQNVLLAFFADEEKGLKGAYHLAKRMQSEDLNLSYMLNFEMIGKTLTTGKNQVYLTGYKLSNMASKFNAISPNFVQFLPQAKEFNLFKRSDNYAFYQELGIPAQTFSSFDFKNYDFYHKAGDEAHKQDLENMNSIIQTAAFSITQLLKNKETITMNAEIQP